MIRKLFNLSITSIFFISFFSCQPKIKIIEISPEEKIFYEIFPLIIKNTYSDLRLLPPFPPGSKLDVNNKVIYDNSIKTKKILERWEGKKKKVLADTTSILILVQDSIKISVLDNKTSSNIESKLSLNKLKSYNSKINFKYRSKFSIEREFWRNKNNSNIDGILSIGKIYINENKTEVHFSIGYTRGPLDGSGGKIYFKKSVDGNWELKNYINTWIS